MLRHQALRNQASIDILGAIQEPVNFAPDVPATLFVHSTHELNALPTKVRRNVLKHVFGRCSSLIVDFARDNLKKGVGALAILSISPGHCTAGYGPGRMRRGITFALRRKITWR